MVQHFLATRGDLVDSELARVGEVCISKLHGAVRAATTATAPAAVPYYISVDLVAFIRELLTVKWGDRSRLQSSGLLNEQYCIRKQDRAKLLSATFALRSILHLAGRLSLDTHACILLSQSQAQDIFKPLRCIVNSACCRPAWYAFFDCFLTDDLAVWLHKISSNATRPANLPSSSVVTHGTIARGSNYTVADAGFLIDLQHVRIRLRCSTSGRHFTEPRLVSNDRREAVAVLVDEQNMCEDHTQDDHSDCDSEISVDDLERLEEAVGEEDVKADGEAEAEVEAEETTEEAEVSGEQADVYIPIRTPTSPMELEWVRIKEKDAVKNRALDELMDLIGLEDVKRSFLDLLGKITTAKRQGLDLSEDRLGAIFLGNPGSGKTTVARLYGKFLAETGALPGSNFEEVSGVYLAREGVHICKTMIEKVYEDGYSSRSGGTFFVDDAYGLLEHRGERVLEYMLGEIERTRGKIAFIFAGYETKMDEFLGYNPGMSSRIPHRVKFKDFEGTELLELLQRNITKRFKDKIKIEDGSDGRYMRIAAKRLARRGGSQGFGNAREVENVFAKMTTRQSTRIEAARKAGEDVDDFYLSVEDIIGPEPTDALLDSKAYAELQEMVGLESVKRSLQDLVDQFQDNYKRELLELPVVEASLNRLFLGPPGTGKTTVAKLYGQILADIGLLSTSEVITKTPSDLIGPYIGWSERSTRQALEAARGKVLVIDEAYMLAGNKSGCRPGPDSFRQGVIDTIVSMVQSTPGEDRAVLLLGYTDRMMDLLGHNAGLVRRFPVESAFFFEDYDNDQLLSIMEKKLVTQGLSTTDLAKTVAIDVLAKTRRRPNFGNAGEIENLLGRAKARFQRRISSIPRAERTGEVILNPEDFDPEHDRIKDAVANCKQLFSDVVGCENVIDQLVGYIQTSENLKKMRLPLEEYLPFNFIFKGPPGTGKTTTARKVGRIFYDMCLLGSSEVVECSVTDLVAGYTGQTGPQVLAKLDSALGKVLFIDEAYRLDESSFAREALDELVDSLTKPRYKGKMIVVLAGYEHQMNDLLRANPGLSSRFSEEINFKNLDTKDSLELLVRKIERVPGLHVELVAHSSDTKASLAKYRVTASLFELSQLNGWGNGRDIETLAQRIIGHALRNGTAASDGTLTVSNEMVLAELKKFHTERVGRGKGACAPQSRKNTVATCK